MAVQSAVFCLADEAAQVVTVGSLASSAQLFIGTNRRFIINATQDITIKMGDSGMAAANSTTCMRIPSDFTQVLDLGNMHAWIRVFNLGAVNATVYIQALSN